MKPGRFWTITGLASVVFWLVLSPALTVPGLRQGLPGALVGALTVALLQVLIHDPFPPSNPVPNQEQERGN